MQSFLDYVRLSDELYEQAYSRSKIFRETESKERQIYNHLLKVLFYNDSFNNEKNLKDIETWLRDIQSMNTKSAWLTKDMFFSILYAGIEEDFDYKAEKQKLDFDYGNLQGSKLSSDEVKLRLDKIYDRLCKELASKTFESVRAYPELQDRF